MKILKASLLLISLVGIWIYANSFDSDSYDDLGLISVIQEVESEQKAYIPLAFMGAEDFDFSDSGVTGFDIQDLLQTASWDQSTVDGLHSTVVRLEGNLETALQRPQFQTPKVAALELISYQNFVYANRLMLLQSKSHAINGDHTLALRNFNLALKFSLAMRSDQRRFLISYMVGDGMLYSVLNWLHQWLSEYSPSAEVLAAVAENLELIPNYADDSFDEVFSGELMYVQLMLREAVSGSLTERIDRYNEMTDFWNQDLDTWEFEHRPLDFLQALVPKYFIHINESITSTAPDYMILTESANLYCRDIDLEDSQPDLSWWEMLAPNSLASMSGGTQHQFREYFTRRCHSQFYIDAIKTLVAIKRYQLKHADQTSDWLDLVPQYLSNIPVDVFTGDELSYSAKKQWIYATGSNFENNGGGSNQMYSRDCYSDSDCSDNPTVPIKYQYRRIEQPKEDDEECSEKPESSDAEG